MCIPRVCGCLFVRVCVLVASFSLLISLVSLVSDYRKSFGTGASISNIFFSFCVEKTRSSLIGEILKNYFQSFVKVPGGKKISGPLYRMRLCSNFRNLGHSNGLSEENKKIYHKKILKKNRKKDFFILFFYNVQVIFWQRSIILFHRSVK